MDTAGASFTGELGWEVGGRDAGYSSGALGPSGDCIRSLTTDCATSAASASDSRLKPSPSTTATIGKICRVRSAPPVAESSSAASYSAWTQARTTSDADWPSRYSFFIEPRAKIDPEPMEWNRNSSYGPPATS